MERKEDTQKQIKEVEDRMKTLSGAKIKQYLAPISGSNLDELTSKLESLQDHLSKIEGTAKQNFQIKGVS